LPYIQKQVPVDPPQKVGTSQTSRSGSLLYIAIQQGGGLKSEPAYPIQLDAKFVHGADFIKFDPSNDTARLEVQSLLRDEATGALVRLNYTGTVSMAGGMGKVLRGDSDAATTGFGDGCKFFLSSLFSSFFKRLLRDAV
jgi:hypothetical protein